MMALTVWERRMMAQPKLQKERRMMARSRNRNVNGLPFLLGGLIVFPRKRILFKTSFLTVCSA